MPDPAFDWSLFNQSLSDGANDLGIAVTTAQIELLSQHCALVLAQRLRAGLTAIADPVPAAIKHYLDCLAALLIRDIRPGDRVADVGSGAGFPGLVLAIARPEAAYTLIESNRRRGAFLEGCVRALGLPHVCIVAERAETVGRDPAHREAYDLAVSRALAPTPVLLECCLPLVRVGGDCVALKGPAGQIELSRSQRALEVLGGEVGAIRALSLPHGMGDRLLVRVTTRRETPARYPRRPGAPAKRPL